MASLVLAPFFNPRSIAVVGASADRGKAGHQVLWNMVRLGFPGKVFPVNPNEKAILELPCYPSLHEIPDPVEMMVVCVPAHAVPGVFEDAKRRGDVRAAVVLSAGFSETQVPERVELERRMVATAGEAGIRVLGPNCVGVMNTANGLDTTFAPNVRQVQGGMSVITQSGSLGAAILMFAGDQPVPVGFAKFAHVGNMCDVGLLDVLDYYREDPETRVIAVYMEGVGDARRFIEAAGEVARSKPVVMLKVGTTELGSRATVSHTGSLAGSDAVYEGALRQAGIIRARTVEELLDAAKALSLCTPPGGDRICILTEAGGPGIIAMDAFCGEGAGRLAELSPETVSALRQIVPPMAIVNRPHGYVDMTAAVSEEGHAQALEVVLADREVDAVILISVPPTFLDPDLLAGRVAAVASKRAKPVLACLLAGDWVKEARRTLEAAGVPTFDMPDRAAQAMSAMMRRAAFLRRNEEAGVVPGSPSGAIDPDSCPCPGPATGTGVRPGSPPGAVPGPGSRPEPVVLRDLIEEARTAGVTEVTARKILERYGVSQGPWAVAGGPSEALEAAARVGYPVAVKIVSSKVSHKSDVGGVRVGLASPAEISEALDDMTRRVQKAAGKDALEGFLIAPVAAPGVEVIVGATRDPQMGPVAMFGLGGVAAEVFHDVVFRLAPLDRRVAREMIESIQSSALLTGYRGQPAADLGSLADLLVVLSRIIAEQDDINTIELNPVRVRSSGFDVLDARVVL